MNLPSPQGEPVPERTCSLGEGTAEGWLDGSR